MPRSHFPPALFLAPLLFGLAAADAATLDRSTFTEVINRVTVIDTASRKTRPARERDLFVAPDVIRTGPDSRAELIAPDQTVTRIGSNTIFSFARDSRELELEKGAVLFNSPPGKGGGAIRTPAASAAVLGTTLIVATTPKGDMKVLLIEGKGKVTMPGGDTRILHAGQMVIVHGRQASDVLDFRLQDEVMNARLIKGFHTPLPSTPKIARAERAQRRAIDDGRLGPRDHRPPPREGFPPPPPPPRGDQQIGGAIPPPPPKDSKQPPPPPPGSIPPPPKKTQSSGGTTTPPPTRTGGGTKTGGTVIGPTQ